MYLVLKAQNMFQTHAEGYKTAQLQVFLQCTDDDNTFIMQLKAQIMHDRFPDYCSCTATTMYYIHNKTVATGITYTSICALHC